MYETILGKTCFRGLETLPFLTTFCWLCVLPLVANVLRFVPLLLQAVPIFTFSNQAGVDMLETTLVALQDISLEKIFDDHGRKNICSELPHIMNQVR